MRTIANISELTNALGEEYRFAVRDGNGSPTFDENKQIISTAGDTCDLIESLLTQYIEVKWAFWNGDSKVFARVMESVRDCRNDSESAKIEVAEGDYEWLVGDGQGVVGILDRKMPAGERARLGIDEENELAHPTVGMLVWGANESKLRSYLKAE
jgi:hypothetical protein